MRAMRIEHKHKQKSRTEYDGSVRTNAVAYCLRLGFFAGLIWGVGRWLLYMIHFTKVIPGFLADPFFRQAFLKTAWGHTIGIAAFIVFSIIATFLYKLVLGRFSGPWPGVLYGLFWWLVLFVMTGPSLGLFQPFNQIGYDTISTECCLYVIWGLFIGYTIAFEYTDEVSREPMGAH
ncbi:YqhR family membrane protein [Paenibacillus sp. R14(2021)]|uniref:YqhR family membrane protein n=1 Tax=Paenibacillus sp. R14(2021) TaxID=2859228 RepID=UPI002157B6BF|nr:YqhR family membrane protein [Paenibacillus sp. R14(2021)]